MTLQKIKIKFVKGATLAGKKFLLYKSKYNSKFTAMKKYVMFILLGAFTMCLSSVSYAVDTGPHKYGVEKAYLSKIDKSVETPVVYHYDAILNPEPEQWYRREFPADLSAYALPKHYLLPTSKLWLITHAIKFC